MESQQVRHEPLGQVIEGDANRGRYAVPSRGRQKRGNSKQVAMQEEYLDEKISKKILDMSREQSLEEEMQEQREWRRERNQNQMHQDPYAESTVSDGEKEEVDDFLIDEVEEE